MLHLVSRNMEIGNHLPEVLWVWDLRLLKGNDIAQKMANPSVAATRV